MCCTVCLKLTILFRPFSRGPLAGLPHQNAKLGQVPEPSHVQHYPEVRVETVLNPYNLQLLRYALKINNNLQNTRSESAARYFVF